MPGPRPKHEKPKRNQRIGTYISFLDKEVHQKLAAEVQKLAAADAKLELKVSEGDLENEPSGLLAAVAFSLFYSFLRDNRCGCVPTCLELLPVQSHLWEDKDNHE